MPTYPYQCPSCGEKQDIVKSISAIDLIENCTKCTTEMTGEHRHIVGGEFLYAGVEDAEYNHGLGCVTYGRKHRAQIARDRGLEEIGNSELPSKTWDRLESDREKRHQRGWDDMLEDRICLSR